jgi:hypothetical protein
MNKMSDFVGREDGSGIPQIIKPFNPRRLVSSGMLRRVALVTTVVSEELIATLIRVTRIGELGTLAVTNNRSTLRRNFFTKFL